MTPRTEVAATGAHEPSPDHVIPGVSPVPVADRAATPGHCATPLPAADATGCPATVDHVPVPRSVVAAELSRAEQPGGDAAGTPAGTPAPSGLSGGRYEILGQLGRGGMGVVYRARDGRSGRVVALKTMRRQDGTSLELFKREFRYLQGVAHPNLVQLYELESDGNEWLLTMELVEGVNFLSYVRPGAHRPVVEPSVPAAAEAEGIVLPVSHSPLCLDRLRETLGQLAEGIAALHAHRRAHRDLKPGNVRVTPEGRVVVLDFGLATDLGTTGQHLHTGQMLLGTYPYMAPEQGRTPPVSSPASDWYSVGVMLYQALTGLLPFTGTALQMMLDKQSRDPKPPRHSWPEVPKDLNDLCMALLRRRPEDRPAATEILESLARQPFTPPAGAPVAGGTPLLGRERHLACLNEAYATSRQRRAVLVAVSGPSGIGKSALIRHFLDGLRGRGAIVLAGRCYEHESVPFKALDPIVDELGRYLHSLPYHDVEVRLPRDVGPLTRVFPVLGRIEAVAEAAARSTLSPDPQEVRRLAFAGLRELLARVGDRQPLVLHIDDLQWGDIDSTYLIADLLQPPDPPPLLLVTAFRSEDTDSPCLRALAQIVGRGQAIVHRDLPILPLTEGETRDLVLQFLGAEGDRHAAGIFRESGGNPFFITELVQELLSKAGRGEGGSDRGEITLDELIRSRVKRLPEGAQRLLEVVAVSGRPLAATSAYRVAEGVQDARVHSVRLEAERLLRGIGEADNIKLETYHDRVREAVLDGLAVELRRGCHGRLASVLEDLGQGDFEELAFHFEEAGQGDKAGAYYSRAADRAAASLVFDHAAGLYQKSLDLLQLDPVESPRLQTKLADALANAGRGAEAGPLYLTVANTASGLEKLELERKAMEQFMVSGRTEEGLAVIRRLLGQFGQRLPGGPRRAMLAAIWEVIRFRLRGLHFRERPAEQIPPEELWRIDVLRTAAHPLSVVDSVLSSLYMLRAARWALDSGEPHRIARGLSSVAILTSCEGVVTRNRVAEMQQTITGLGDRFWDPFGKAYYVFSRATVHWAYGEWEQLLTGLERTEEVIAEEKVSFANYLTTHQHLYLDGLMMTGRWQRFAADVVRYLEAARRKGDRYATSTMLVHSYLPALMADRPDLAEGFARQSRDAWPQKGNVMAGYWGLYARVEALLYRGDGVTAVELLRREQETLNGSTHFRLLLLQVTNLLMVHLQGRTMLAAARRMAPGGWYFDERSRLLRSVARQAGTIEKAKAPWANPLARLLRAGVASLHGHREAAVTQLAEAEQGFTGAGMRMYAAAARRQRGRLLGGEEGQALVGSADGFMVEQDIHKPARIAAMLAPGFAD